MHFYPVAVSDAVIISILSTIVGLGVPVVTTLGAVIIVMLNSSHSRQDVAAQKLDNLTVKQDEIHKQTNGNLTELQAKYDALQAENKRLLAATPPSVATAILDQAAVAAPKAPTTHVE